MYVCWAKSFDFGLEESISLSYVLYVPNWCKRNQKKQFYTYFIRIHAYTYDMHNESIFIAVASFQSTIPLLTFCFELKLYFSLVLFSSQILWHHCWYFFSHLYFRMRNPESSIFRDAIPKWWRFNVPHAGVRTLSRISSQILRSWDCVCTEILAPERHYLSVTLWAKNERFYLSTPPCGQQTQNTFQFNFIVQITFFTGI